MISTGFDLIVRRGERNARLWIPCARLHLRCRWNASLARTYDISALNGSVRADTTCLTLVGGSLASERLTS